MNKDITYLGKKLGKKVFFAQLTLLIVVSSLFLFNEKYFISSILGGFIALFANYVFTFFSFLFGGGRFVKLITLLIFLGEILKILVTILMFSFVFTSFENLELKPLFLTYGLVQLTGMFIPFYFETKIRNK